MSVPLHELDRVAAISVDTTKQVEHRGKGGVAQGNLLVNIGTITGTWSISAQIVVDGVAFTTHEVTGQTTTGVKILTPVANILGVPRPHQIFWDNTVAGSITAAVYMVGA